MPSPADKCLPFARGDTLAQGVLSMDTSVANNLVGKLYWTEDTQHSTGTMVCLRVVRAEVALTVARKFVAWGTDADDFGRTVASFAPTAGSATKPIDDVYTAGSTISQYDLFYVIESGPVLVVTEGSSVNLAAQAPVATDASGCVNGAAAAAGETVIGHIDEASTDTSTNVQIWVAPGLRASEAAG